jgi:hypothetical protein
MKSEARERHLKSLDRALKKHTSSKMNPKHGMTRQDVDTERSRGENLSVLNPIFRIAANVLILSLYATIFFLIDGPWLRVSLFFAVAVLVRSLTFFAMTSGSGSRLSERFAMPIVTLIYGALIYSTLIGVLYLVGNLFPSSMPVLKIILIGLMVIVAFKSTFPLGNFTGARRHNLRS